jgi:RimJ/RimL family protein N-acetyltransferase
MYLETERMILREFTTDDIDDFHEIFSDPVVMEHTEPPYDKEKSLRFLTSFCIERSPKGGFAAVLRETGKVIGYVLFKSIDEPEIYEIGWIFNKDYWQKGYASEICSRLVQHGFEDMNLHKICAEATDGIKSVSLMKKLGMAQEGIQREHSKSPTGEWLDLYWYAVLAEEYFKSTSVKNQCK